MNKKLQSKLTTVFMLVVLFAQTLSPVMTVFAEDGTNESSVSSQIAKGVSSTLDTTSTSSLSTPAAPPVSVTSESSVSAPAVSTTQTTEASATTEPNVSNQTDGEVATEESTEEDEEPAQSSTGESNSEEAKVLAEEPKRAPQNIRPLLENSDFLATPIKIKLGEKEIIVSEGMAPIELKKGDVFQIGYSWAIPAHLDGKLVQGDWYEESLPTGIEQIEGNGDLKDSSGEVFGIYVFSGGKLRIEFNNKVETEAGIAGTVWYAQELTNEGEAGSGEITIPVNDENVKVPIFMQPSGGSSISKAVKKDVQEAGRIDWTVSINTNLQKLVNPKVLEVLPDTLSFTDVVIHRQTVNAKGEVTGKLEPALVKNIDYRVDTKGNVTFIGAYGETRDSFSLVYQTKIIDEKIPAEGGTVKFKNTASLEADNTETISATAEDSREYGKFLQKTVKVNTSGPRLFDWTIKFNYGEKDLAAGTWLKDELTGTSSSIVPGSIKITDENGAELKGFTAEISDKTGQGFTVKFPAGVPRKKVLITYQTKYDAIISGDDNPEIKNTVTTNVSSGTGGEGGAGTNLGTEGSVGVGEQGLSKTGSIDYNNHTVKWTIDINKGQYEMFNWALTDKISDNQKMNADFVIKDSDGITLTKDKDYDFSQSGNSFNVKFKGKLATEGTTKSYTITYSTTFDPRTLEGKLNNEASHEWDDNKGNTYNRKKNFPIDSKSEYMNNATKSGSYNAKAKEITWTITANYMQDELNGAYISDTIKNDPKQQYILKSAQLHEMTINPDGTVTQGDLVTPSQLKEPTDSDSELKVGLPNGKKAYRLTFKTQLGERVIETGEKINNIAIYHNTTSTSVDASVQPAHAGNHLAKNGTADGMNYAKWSIEINTAQSTLKNVKIIDKPSANLVVDLSSLKVFKTSFDSKNKLQKTTETLTEGTDYTAGLVTNNDTGEQTLTLEFAKIDTAYIVEYRTLVLPVKPGVSQEASNNVSITAEGSKPVEDDKNSSTTVNVSGGTASSAPGKLILKKIDETNSTPLQGVAFELWTVDADNKKSVKLREGRTGADGQLLFGGLRTNTNYLVIEKETLDGYVINPEFKEGQLLKIPSDPTEGTKPVDFSYEVKNDTFEVSFSKVAKAEQELAAIKLQGAEFILQRKSDNKYYNGDQKGISQEKNWISNRESATKFISDKDGLVKAKGLLEGSYSFIEIKAPTGYELSNPVTQVPFKIIKEDNQFKMEKAIAPVVNTREKTAVEVTKTWGNEHSLFDTRPENVEVQLLRGTQPVTGIANQLLNEGNDWKVSFTGLVKYDDNGVPYAYTVKEINPDKRYTPIITPNEKTNEVTVTNKLQTVDISGEKIWADYNDNTNSDLTTRPKSIKVKLMQVIDRVETSVKDKSGKGIIIDVAAGKDNKWKFSFEKLPRLDKNGKEINYSVKEVAFVLEGNDQYVPVVEKNEDGTFTLTNTYKNTEKISVKGEKEWVDFDNKFGLRPDSITLHLWRVKKDALTGKYNDESAVEVEQTSISGPQNENWPYSYDELTKYDEAGRLYRYFVTEDKVNGYTTKIDEATGKITNTLETTEVSVTKGWSDFDNKFGLRPESIKVQLLQDEEDDDAPSKIIDIATIAPKNDSGEWSYTFVDLPKYDTTGKEYGYTVEEEKVPGYTTSILNPLSEVEGVINFNIVNTLETTEVSVSKGWSDFDNKFGLRPESIKVQLLQGDDDEDAPSKIIDVATITPNDSGEWTYTFTDLPKYDTTGEEVEEYAYTVKEEKVQGYTTSITNPLSEVDGLISFNIVNTLDTTEAPVTKTWSDFDDKFSLRPASITVRLFQNEKEIAQVLAAEVKADEAGNWSHIFTELPTVDSEGKAYVYTIKEDKVTGYTTTIDQATGTITNTLDTTEVPVTKTWSDFDDKFSLRPASITVRLFQNEKEIAQVPAAEIKADEAGNWSHIFMELPTVDSKGQAYVYTIKEDTVPGYTTTIDQITGTITNTLDTTEVPVTKTWSDFDDKFNLRPASITVRLFQNEKEIAQVPAAEIKADEAGNWSHIFAELPTVDSKGQTYVYTIKEDTVPGYTTAIDQATGTITNTLDTMNVTGQKVWKDNNDQAGLRPDSITINLLQNGKKITETKVTADKAGNWNFTFENLPKVDQAGKAFEYTVTENAVEGYTVKIDGTTITNTVILKENSEKPTKPSKPVTPTKPNNNKENKLPQMGEVVSPIFGALGFALVASAGTAVTIRRRKNK